MKRALFISLLFMFGISGISQDYYLVNHIAEEGWTTTITVYNDGITDQTVTLHYWHHPAEPEMTYSDLVIPANGSAAFNNALFGYDGVAIIEAIHESPVRVKLSYRYGTSRSLAEFMLPQVTDLTRATASNWVIPNPYLSHMDWLGFAIANFNTDPAHVILTAYKDGVAVAVADIDVISNNKSVDVSSGFFPGLNYADIDTVTIDSDITIPPPVAIIGNTEQDRHLFFLGASYAPSGSISSGIPITYTVPHVAENNWHTTITAINTSDTEETVTLNSWHSDGTTDQVGAVFSVPAYGSLVLSAGTDFSYEGTATVTANATVRVKLSYQYQDSQSISDFVLDSTTGIEWILPNSVHDWFQWFGIAVGNSTDSDVAIAIDAYRNGVLLGTFSKRLHTHTKYVGLSSDIWTGINYADIDMVIVRSDKPITAPISITGDTAQDRHVFFQGTELSRETESGVTDPAFDAYLLANFDADSSGTIEVSERDAVTEIDTTINNPWHGRIKDITGIANFKNLDTLVCNNENLSWLPNMYGMSSLRILKASHNSIVRIDGFEPLTGLFHLYLDFNQLDTIPDVSAMTILQTFWVQNNQLSEVPGLSSLTDLQFVMLEHNQFTGLPDLTASADNLSNLRFSYNQMNNIYNLSVFPHLIALSCSSNNLSSVPGLSSLTSLTFIECNYNQLTSLTELSSFTNLTWVAISGNPLTSMPDLSLNTQLAYLYCEDMNISSIPGLSTFTHLQRLYCDGTDISDLSAIAGLTELQFLNVSGTPITSLPDMSALTQLKYLYMKNCLLADIPDVTNSTQLEVFLCYGNYFGSDDCSRIQAISAMGIPSFIYNPQADGSTLTCP